MWNPRKNYNPIQPTVFFGRDDIRYSEILPDVRLQSLIYCYWELKTRQPLQASYQYGVVSDGCMDLFFEVGKPHESLIMGFSNQYTTLSLGNSFRYFGVRFFPGIFPQLFDVDASELSNSVVELQEINRDLADFIIRATELGWNTVDLISLFNGWFCKHLHSKPIETDRRLYNAIELVFQTGGSLLIEKDIDTGLSPRQLRRLFKFYIGESAKAFSRVVRFQNFLQRSIIQKQGASKDQETDTYFDQSHLIRDFKKFYGTTPGCLLDR